MDTIQPGDQILTKHGEILTPLINFFQKIKSKDGKSKYSHAGLIIDSKGNTFEARLYLKEYNLSKYIGSEVFIYRHCCMNQKTFDKYYPILKRESINRIYPFYRLGFHTIPHLSKWAPLDRGVCSEKNAKFNYICEFMSSWKGITPDNLHDMVCDFWADQWEIVFDGVLTSEVYNELIT